MLIHQQLAGAQEKIALKFGEKSITYEKLHNIIPAFAAHLQKNGIKQGARVALLCQNSPEFIYSYFALASIGATVIPLNLLLTLEEITYILQDSQASALLIHEKIAQKSPAFTDISIGKLITVSDSLFEALPQENAQQRATCRGDDMSTILYTSGTTGKPKGAMLSHNNLIANANSTIKAFEVTADDHFLCVLPMFHSFAFTVCVLAPLFSGGTITIQESFNPKETCSLIKDNGITVFCGVPSMFNFINHTADAAAMKTLRAAVSGGAPLPVEVLEAFENKFNTPLYEGYGLTEASPVVSFNPLHRERKKGSVGTAIPDVEVKIVDDNGKELPTREIGEIIVRGENIMLGYLNLPEDTAKTLRDGWLYTGDIGYMDEEGYVFIVDRKKDLIIVGGLNVYPREVEEVIYTYPGILECAVIGIPDVARGEIIIAYIVPKEGCTIDNKQLLKHLKQHLALYKLPKYIKMIDSIPKTGTGKMDKKQLRKIALEG